MFDYYKPSGPLSCPIDGHPLLDWQGKDGPRLLLVWQEGMKHPIDHWVDEEVRFSKSHPTRFTLPPTFTIYTGDCPMHQPIIATCATEDDIWCSTEIYLPRDPGQVRMLDELGIPGRATGQETAAKLREFILVDLTTQMAFLPNRTRAWPRERLLAWLRVWGDVHLVGEDMYTFQSWVGRWTQFTFRQDGRMYLIGTHSRAWPEHTS